MEILISNRAEAPADLELIKKISLFVLSNEKAADGSEISFSLVEPAEMKRLNKQYRKKDEATDVLSFAYNEDSITDGMLGDIILCPAEIRLKAQKQQLRYREYFELLIVHGVLHLLGYGHESDSAAIVMSEREEQLLTDYERPK